MIEPLRFGIVGCGVIGPTHAEAIKCLPQARLVAVADPASEHAQTLARRYGATPYTNLSEMLDKERLDVVNVCTPSGLHGAQAQQVMRSGRHVIVEKPMELSHAAIEEVLRVQRETGVKLAVISQHRFDPASRRVHDLVSSGALGRLVLGNAHVPWWRTQAYYDSGAWRGTWELDGGVLMNQAIHTIDLLQWLLGPARSVYAYTDTLTHRMEAEDVAVAVLRFSSGALGTIAATTSAYPGVLTRLEVCGDKGSAVIENDLLASLHLAQDDHSDPQPEHERRTERANTGALSTAQDPAAVSASSHALQIADMIRAIQENGDPLVDGQAGRRPVEITLGIYESARTGREVMLT